MSRHWSDDVRNAGGPAFPGKVEEVGIRYMNGSYTTHMVDKPGMSLRDYFAARAVPAIVSLAGNDLANVDGMPAIIARDAYRVADAMLKARESNQPPVGVTHLGGEPAKDYQP
jgi:hypothetical protein